jgi:hypothetical protein
MTKELEAQELTERTDYSFLLHSPLFRWSERGLCRVIGDEKITFAMCHLANLAALFPLRPPRVRQNAAATNCRRMIAKTYAPLGYIPKHSLTN